MNASYEGALKKAANFSGPRVSGGRGVPLGTQEGGQPDPPVPDTQGPHGATHTEGNPRGGVHTDTQDPGRAVLQETPSPQTRRGHRAHVPGEPQGVVSTQTPATQTPVGTQKVHPRFCYY